MRKLRLTLASLAAATLAAIVAAVALAAPGAVGLAASPSAGAARAVYCPPPEKKARAKAVAAFVKGLRKQQDAYFRRVRGKKQRAEFVRKQQAQLRVLQKQLDACES